MSGPTTETGKRLFAGGDGPSAWLIRYRSDITKVEQEAAAAERKRLYEVVLGETRYPSREWGREFLDADHITGLLLAEPSEDSDHE